MAQEGAYYGLYQAQARNMDVDMDDAVDSAVGDKKDDAK